MKNAVSKNTLIETRAKVVAGYAEISAKLEKVNAERTKLQNDLHANSGAIQILDKLIADVSAAPAKPATT